MKRYIVLVCCGLALSAFASQESNTLFRTISYADLSRMTSNQLAQVTGELEKRTEDPLIEVTGGKLSFLSPEELIEYERDVAVWKILALRMSIALDERVAAKFKKRARPSRSQTLDALLDETASTNGHPSSLPPGKASSPTNNPRG